MLKISEMAALANTTRRTLLYYDQQGLFRPHERSNAGYRYYDYNQLYDLLLILSLRRLGLTIDEIKKIVKSPNSLPIKELQQIENRLAKEAKDINRSRDAITKIINHRRQQEPSTTFEPHVIYLPEREFWCSSQSASCTDQEVAEMFANFYQQLAPLAMIDETQSGYLTTLNLNEPSGYSAAAFRVIKEVSNANEVVFPTIHQPAGQYLQICVTNNNRGVANGLELLKAFCNQHHYHTDNHLWQINCGNRLNKRGASSTMWLEYRLHSQK